VDIAERTLEGGDLLLLCSDGLNTMLSDQEIDAILGRFTDLKEIAQQMVREANRKGGVDNITVILARARA
jgi:protein phosphatase